MLRLYYQLKKEEKMIATALALQTATQDAVMDESTMTLASSIYHNRNQMTDDEFARAMFAYSAHIASLTATLATNVLLTESQLDEMIDVIKEFDELGKEAL
jgi:hypothetical protein